MNNLAIRKTDERNSDFRGFKSMNDSKILSKLPAVLDWSAAIWSGFISGTVSLFVSIVLPWIIINDPLLIVRLMASILLGPGVISPQNDLVPGVYVVAILTHFSLSFAFTFIIAIKGIRISFCIFVSLCQSLPAFFQPGSKK